jgi:aminopeptidase N
MTLTGSSLEAGAQTAPPPGTGVPRELARRRAEHYRDVRYLLDLTLKPGAERLEGRLKVSVTLDAAAGDLVLDWRTLKKDDDPRSHVSSVKANGRAVTDAQFVNEHILIPSAYTKAGVNEVELGFESPISAAGSAVTRYLDREDNSEYVYTLFVPSDASTAFPCFDQPDLKARFTLRVTAPEAWRVVSNTEGVVPHESDETAGGLPQSPPKGMLRHAFPETEPISTYQFAFAAGPFEVLEVQRKVLMHRYPLEQKAGRTSRVHGPDILTPAGDTPRIRLFVRQSKRQRAEKELEEVARINREGVKFFEEYFGHRFPFPKYDLVLIPEFAYNGMEHAGATFLREEGVLFPSDPTASDIAARAETMLHEAAHQWFGDLVTMRWFDDLWLKEGFATFMAYKAFEGVMPRLDAWKVFHLRTKPLAYLTDVTKGTTPIWQEIANLSAAKSAYGNIVYRKAPSMLRQAEFYLGPREFRDAVRLFVKEHAYANATWEDLVGAFERTSGRKLDAWAASWVKRRGMPDVRVRWTTNRSGLVNHFEIEERDALGEGGSWPMRVKLLLAPGAGKARPEVLTLTLPGAGVTKDPAALGKRRPAFVFANFEDYGYGRFLLDDESRAYVVGNMNAIKDDFLRALLWGSLWESVREAELAPADFVELAVKQAPDERDDVMLAFVLARAQTAFTRFLSAAQQRALAPRLEGLLREGMLNAATPGQRITYFRTYREVARSPAALDDLNDILAGKLQVPGMTLRTRDRFDIIRALVAAGDARAPELLRKQSEADRTDDARRYAYAAGAAAPDASVKKRYFGQFVGDRELAESWIEAGFGPFNTPQQAALTLPYLEPALAELPTLKRTRKIFFVNGWLAAFIGGQCDARAAGVVRDFLARNPALDRDLRLKVLEAADGLERCVRVRARFAAETPDAARRDKIRRERSPPLRGAATTREKENGNRSLRAGDRRTPHPTPSVSRRVLVAPRVRSSHRVHRRGDHHGTHTNYSTSEGRSQHGLRVPKLRPSARARRDIRLATRRRAAIRRRCSAGRLLSQLKTGRAGRHG